MFEWMRLLLTYQLNSRFICLLCDRSLSDQDFLGDLDVMDESDLVTAASWSSCLPPLFSLSFFNIRSFPVVFHLRPAPDLLNY